MNIFKALKRYVQYYRHITQEGKGEGETSGIITASMLQWHVFSNSKAIIVKIPSRLWWVKSWWIVFRKNKLENDQEFDLYCFFQICTVFLVCGTWADPEPQSKDYLPPKHGTAPATAHHAGGRHPGGEDGPSVSQLAYNNWIKLIFLTRWKAYFDRMVVYVKYAIKRRRNF